jgi:hypothetical protein
MICVGKSLFEHVFVRVVLATLTEQWLQPLLQYPDRPAVRLSKFHVDRRNRATGDRCELECEAVDRPRYPPQQ